MAARLARHRGIGLRLTLSALLFIGAAWLFGGVAEDVVSGDPLVDVDHAVSRWLQAHTTPAVSGAMQWIGDAHGAVPIAVLGVAFALWLAWRRQGRWLLTLVFALPGGMLANLAMKPIFHRSRPALEEPLLALASYSFPSGHVTAATLLYGLSAAYAASCTRRIGRRAACFGVAAFMVVVVGASRMILGVHYFSDVVAAAAWGTAWLVLCGVSVDAWQRRSRT